MNGTYLNNEKVGKLPIKLKHGDILKLGLESGPNDKCVIALVHLHYPSLEKTISLESLIKEMDKEKKQEPWRGGQASGPEGCPRG